jgi:phosphatidate cytidylyltransferase
MPKAGGAPGGARLWLATEFGARVGSSVVLAAVALWAAYIGGWPFALFWLAAGIAVLVEWIGMTRTEPRRLTQALLGGGLIVLTGIALHALPVAFGLAAAFVFAAAAVGLTRTGEGRLWALSGFAYAAVIVLVPPLVRENPQLDLVGLLWMFAVVWTTDIAAYFTGRRFGGPKLWPRVSPKKTWSGFMGGLAAGAAAGIAVPLLAARLGWNPPVGWPFIAAVSVLASVLSQLGDLGESALKRRFGVKNSGHLIPGHGGVMDRLDGFWAVALLVGAIMAGVSAVRI